MKGFRINPALSFVSIILVVLLFTYTAASKLIEYDKFVFQMGLSPFLPIRFFATALGWLIPFFEIIIVIAVLSDRWRRAGLKATLALLIAFELYIGSMLLTELQLPCACGGVFSIMSWQTHLIFNAFFVLFALIGMGYRSTKDAGICQFKNRIFNA